MAEVPASTRDEALFIPVAIREESRGAPRNDKGDLTTLRRHERSPRATHNLRGTLGFPPKLKVNYEILPCMLEEGLLSCSVSKERQRLLGTRKGPRHALRNSRSFKTSPCHLKRNVEFPATFKKSPVFPASTRDEALFLCTDSIGVPRGPSNSTIFLTSHKHPEKLPEVTVTCQGKPGFPAATTERTRYSPFKAS